MDNRVYLAGQALAGELVRVNTEKGTMAWKDDEAEVYADRCVAFADAILSRLSNDQQ